MFIMDADYVMVLQSNGMVKVFFNPLWSSTKVRNIKQLIGGTKMSFIGIP